MSQSPSTKVREAGSSTPARRRIGRRPSATHILIAVVVILAFVLNLLVLRDRDSTTLVAVSDGPLSAGELLALDSLRLVPVDSDFDGLESLIEESEVAGFEGWVLSDSIAEGSIIAESSLVAPGSSDGLRTMSLPVPIEHAAGGSVSAGDTLDVIAVRDGQAEFVATGLAVVSVSEQSSGQIGTIGSYHVVVAVAPDQALALASALDTGSVELVRSTGAAELPRPGAVDG